MSSLQQANGLFAASVPIRVSALRFGMIFVLNQNVTVSLHARSSAVAVVTGRRDAIRLSRVLINPPFLEPLSRIFFIRRDQVKTCWINSRRMTERPDMARQQEIKGFDLIWVPLPLIEFRQRLHNGRTADRDLSDRWRGLDPQSGCGQAEGSANDAHPCLRDPFAILARGVGWIQEMTEAVLGPSILLVV
jgi:hypothetical protein